MYRKVRTEEGELKLSIFSQEGIYYVHDNGCAVRQLERNVGEKYQTVLEKVCHSMWIRDEKVFGCFSQRFHFMKYLQKLVFIAHGDLICDDLECDGNDISITADISGGDFISVLFRFLNLAVLLSELGQLIELPKL